MTLPIHLSFQYNQSNCVVGEVLVALLLQLKFPFKITCSQFERTITQLLENERKKLLLTYREELNTRFITLELLDLPLL